MNKKGVDLFILPLQWEPINATFLTMESLQRIFDALRRKVPESSHILFCNVLMWDMWKELDCSTSIACFTV